MITAKNRHDLYTGYNRRRMGPERVHGHSVSPYQISTFLARCFSFHGKAYPVTAQGSFVFLEEFFYC